MIYMMVCCIKAGVFVLVYNCTRVRSVVIIHAIAFNIDPDLLIYDMCGGDISMQSACVLQGHVTCIRHLARCTDIWLTWTQRPRCNISSRVLIRRDLISMYHRL